MFKPMLASPADFNNLRWPLLASPKLDGIRCTIVNDVALTRSLKAIPNKHIRSVLSNGALNGFDGELIVGSPTSPTVYRDTNSAVMSVEGNPAFTYCVFDIHNSNQPYGERLAVLKDRVAHLPLDYLQILPQTLITGLSEMEQYETVCLEQGYEGIILRLPQAPYKFGRSTAKEGYLLKVKRMESSEAEIVEIVEEMANTNTATINELGYTERSSHKENLVGKGRMGALKVRDIKTGIEFNIGTGFTAKDRAYIWLRKDDYIGRIVTYNHFPVGVKDLPRFPSFKGFRDASDLGE